MPSEWRDNLSDLWFAFRSDRPTMACYRDIQGNKKALRVLLHLEDPDESADPTDGSQLSDRHIEVWNYRMGALGAYAVYAAVYAPYMENFNHMGPLSAVPIAHWPVHLGVWLVLVLCAWVGGLCLAAGTGEDYEVTK